MQQADINILCTRPLTPALLDEAKLKGIVIDDEQKFEKVLELVKF